MCLAVPARITDLQAADRAWVDMGGVSKEISLALVDGVGVGDYVLVHVGYALHVIDVDEAQRTLALLAAMAEGEAS